MIKKPFGASGPALLKNRSAGLGRGQPVALMRDMVKSQSRVAGMTGIDGDAMKLHIALVTNSLITVPLIPVSSSIISAGIAFAFAPLISAWSPWLKTTERPVKIDASVATIL